jgi:signal transduction histidine kinase/putative methionine-R-sulfoxide reductase with GAF domain
VIPLGQAGGEAPPASRLVGSLGSLSFAVQSAYDVEGLISSIAENLLTIAGADALAVLLLDADTGDLEGDRFDRGNRDAMGHAHITPTPGSFLGRVLRRETLVVEDPIEIRAAGGGGMDWGYGVPETLVGVPIAVGTTLLGVLVVGYRKRVTPTGRRRRTLVFLADQIGFAVERLKLREDLAAKTRSLDEARAALRRVDESKSDLISIVSHELRTPLTAIKAYTETLLDNVALSTAAMQKKFLGIIDEECDRLTRMVNDVLDLSRMESGRRRLTALPLDLARLVQEVAPTVEPELARKRLELTIDLEPDVPPLEADPDLLKQVLVNLIANAAKFTRPDTRVSVRAWPIEDRMAIAVEDRGMGIPQDKLARVFERFYRVEEGGAERVGGTGLGLAIVKSVVELHGGTIRVESVVGEGSRFLVELPLHQRGFRNLMESLAPFLEQPELRSLLQGCVDMVAEVMEAKIVSIMMFNEDGSELRIQAASGLDPDTVARTRVQTGDSIAGWVAQTAEPLYVRDVENDRRFRKMNHPQYETRSLVCAPLHLGGEIVGVVNANNKVSGAPFDDDDLALLVALAKRIGGALERVRAARESGDVSAMVATVRSIIRARRAHLLPGSRRAFKLAADLGRRLRLHGEEVEVLGYVARIHDVGMLSIGDDLLGATRRWTESERRRIEGHPLAGVQVLRPIEFGARVNAIILAHHEHFDGHGYPRGLRGEEIPLAARIIAVLDAFESMTSGRPYRDPLSESEAIAELERCSGTQFDPRVVGEFVALLAEHRATAGGPALTPSEANRDVIG